MRTWPIAPIMLIFLSGCTPGRHGPQAALERLRSDPTRENAAEFLSYGDRAVKLLELLPADERHVVVVTDDVHEGYIAKGAARGTLSFAMGSGSGRVVVSIPLSSIRAIRFAQKPAAGPEEAVPSGLELLTPDLEAAIPSFIEALAQREIKEAIALIKTLEGQDQEARSTAARELGIGKLTSEGASSLVEALRHGDVRFSKYFYIFQAYYCPEEHPPRPPVCRIEASWGVDPPGNYTGLWFSWYRNGRMKSRSPYKNGLPDQEDGTHVGWHPNGRKQYVSFYRGGKPHGTWNVWHDNGQKRSEDHYVDGELHGTSRQWEKNGQVYTETPWKEGEIDGTKVSFYPNGQKRLEEEVKNSMGNGRRTVWYANGQKASEGTWKNAEPHGKLTCWDKKGNIISTRHYENGELISKDGKSWVMEQYEDAEVVPGD